MASKQPPDLQRILDFHALLLQLQKVKRVVHLPESHERENDTEHSYNLAMMSWFLGQYFPELDKNKLVQFALVHDFVEIHAGDTYIYAEQGELESKEAREKEALRLLKKEWPDFSEMTQLISDYESRGSEEAKFVYALDKIMPIIVIFLAGGYTWQKEGVGLDRLHDVKKNKVSLSPEVNGYYQQLYALLKENIHLFPDAPLDVIS